MKFDYFKIPLDKKSEFFGHSILKPIISIKIGFGHETINYAALIDSGADFCIFDAEVGGSNYKTTVGFSYDIAKHGHGILGQKGFFDSFIVKFEYPKERIELTPKK